VAIIGKALADGFLPAAPGTRECEYCDYRRVCGPYENTRVEYKTSTKEGKENKEKSPAYHKLDSLRRLRELR
jgi:hypothetical protein